MLYTSAAILAFFLLFAVVRDLHRKYLSNLPPGPRGLPLLGNLLQLPTQFLWETLEKWSNRYGSVFTIWIGTQPYLIVNDMDAGMEILNKMSAVTSDRAPFIKAREFFVRRKLLQVQDNTPFWRANRRAIHANLNKQASARFHGMQEQDAAHLIHGILHDPSKPFSAHAQRYATSIISGALYGGPAIPHSGIDPLKKVEDLTERLMESASPQRSVVDLLPFLAPVISSMGWFRREADEWFEEAVEEGTKLYRLAEKTDGCGGTTISHSLGSEAAKFGLSEEDAIWLTLSLYMAGAETTHTTLRIFVLALLQHPSILARAQAEVAAVCGGRPPSFEDRERLSFLEAVILETLRWKVAAPGSIAHRASEDFEYRGYTIPKGTVIYPNLSAMSHSPTHFPSPHAFSPARFLTPSGHPLPPGSPLAQASTLPFGHGRRICPGKEFALGGMWIACAYLLWAFEWSSPDGNGDGDGEAGDVGNVGWVDRGIVVSPKEFGVVFRPRVEALEEMLKTALEEERKTETEKQEQS